MGIWIDRLDCDGKIVKIKAKNVDGMMLPVRLFNEDIYIFNSKISVKSISDWYTPNKLIYEPGGAVTTSKTGRI